MVEPTRSGGGVVAAKELHVCPSGPPSITPCWSQAQAEAKASQKRKKWEGGKSERRKRRKQRWRVFREELRDFYDDALDSLRGAVTTGEREL